MVQVNGPLIKSITLEGFLSFGYAPYGLSGFPLTPLDIIIGPNGSGKSNLIEALSIFRSVPTDLPSPIRKGGGVREWLHSGGGFGSSFSDGSGAGMPAARLEVTFGEGHIARTPSGFPSVRYRMVFGEEGDSFVLLDERLENADREGTSDKPYFYFGYENGRPMFNIKEDGNVIRRELRREDVDPRQSIVSQRKDPDAYPELTRLGEVLDHIRIYRNWQFGPGAGVRTACPTDVRTDYLSEDFDNLPARLSVMRRDPELKRRLINMVNEFAESFRDFEVVLEGGMMSLFVEENGRSFPARRLSDGTLRYLCLLAILLDPVPPPLIVIEEPELGLHPDVFPAIRDLLLEASTRTQVVVTTHSTQLVDGMTEYADSVVVCEKHDDVTMLSRLSQAEINKWSEYGSLGALWMAGHLGGLRW